MAPIDISFLSVGLLTAVAAFVDWRTGHIPNRLVLIGLCVGTVLHVLAVSMLQRGSDASLLMLLGRAGLDVFLGLVVCAIAPCLLFRIEAMGGGDVKLLAVVGATLGPALGLQVELCAFLLVSIYAPLRLACEGQLSQLLGNTAALFINPLLPEQRRRAVPQALLTSVVFGPAIFLATLLVAAASRWPR
jgi:prepilin peptidase CpaA